MQHQFSKMMRGLSPHPQLDFLIRKGRQVARKHPLLILIIALVLAASLAAQGVLGSYILSFQDTNGNPVTTLPVCTAAVCEEMVLKAHIQDSSGNPAQRGLVIFQYCSLKGLPPNDITRPDEAPLEACENGSATWAHLGTFKVNESGDAFDDFGVVLIPRTVGFRFRYQGQGSGIANSLSDPPQGQNFTWF
jgi:hypothetical protein